MLFSTDRELLDIHLTKKKTTHCYYRYTSRKSFIKLNNGRSITFSIQQFALTFILLYERLLKEHNKKTW